MIIIYKLTLIDTVECAKNGKQIVKFYFLVDKYLTFDRKLSKFRQYGTRGGAFQSTVQFDVPLLHMLHAMLLARDGNYSQRDNDWLDTAKGRFLQPGLSSMRR